MKYKLLYLLVFLCFSGLVEARFDPYDSDQIDSEQHHNTETWNDKNSYRYPISWERSWTDSAMGYRVNAGSLNVSRFNFEDDIKIRPRPLEPLTASFVQSRREDLVEQSLERELRLGWSMIPGMRLSVLGDVDTRKEFGDLGLAWTLHESGQSLTEIFAWNVDQYYQSKRSDEAAHRDGETKTFGFRSEKNSKNRSIGWRLLLEWDTPLDWTLPSQNWRYQYENRTLHARVDLPLADASVLYTIGKWQRKFERKALLTQTENSSVHKSMTKDAFEAEVGVEHGVDQEIMYSAALQRVWRRVHYDLSKDFSEASIPGETVSPLGVLRNEWGFMLTRHAPVRPDISLQHGFMLNDVYVKEDQRLWKTVEVKYQLLFDFKLNDLTKFAVNTTWDVDQLVRDYPYPKNSPFRPWGGGDLQFMMKI